MYNYHSNSLIFLGAMLNSRYFFLNLMHKVKTHISWRVVCQEHAYLLFLWL